MTVWATRADQVDLRGPNPHDLARSHRFAKWRLAPDRSAPLRLAPDRFAGEPKGLRAGEDRFARLRRARDRSALLRLAPDRSAPSRLALYRSAPLRLAPDRLAPLRLAPVRLAPVRFAAASCARATPSLGGSRPSTVRAACTSAVGWGWSLGAGARLRPRRAGLLCSRTKALRTSTTVGWSRAESTAMRSRA